MYFAFRKRELAHNKWMMILTGFVISFTSTFIFIYDNDIIETLIYVVVILGIVFLLYNETFYRTAIVTIWMICALSMIDTMSGVLYDVSMILLHINGDKWTTLAASFFSLILIWMVGRIYRKNNVAVLKNIHAVNLIGFTILLAIDTLVVTIITVMNTKLEVMRYKNIYLLAIIFVIIGIFIQLASVILLFTQRNVYKEKEELTDKYLNEQKNHYEYLENREIETKKFRHDLRSHMELVSNLAKNHEYDKIDEYIEQMHERIDTFGNVITVQNSIVDAIINQYYARAEQSGVTMEVKGRFPVDCNIDTYDLCTIFSNVLSNALEAAQETEEKYISVECGYTDKSIIIIVKNSFDAQTKSGNAQWKTRKGNTDYHGYGLENIKDSVDRYNGVFDIETDDSMFNVKILFSNRK